MMASWRFLGCTLFLTAVAALHGAGGCTLATAPAATEPADTFATVAGGAVYVSAKAGAGDGDGSAARPLKSIQAAIAVADALPRNGGGSSTGPWVVLGAGDYAEAIVVPGGVSVTGSGSAGATRILPPGGIGIRVSGAGRTFLRDLSVVGAVGSGIAVDTGGVTLSNVTVSGTKASGPKSGNGLDLSGVAFAEIQSCTIRDNAGIGVSAKGSGTVSIIDPLFHTDPRGQNAKDPGSVGIIDPLFLPASNIDHNQGGGVAIIDPLFLPGDGVSLRIESSNIGANQRFGVATLGGNVVIAGSAIHGIVAPDGDGLLIGAPSVAPKSALTVRVTGSIVTGNARAGVLLNGPATLDFQGECSANAHGGIWAQHAAAVVRTNVDALIARNTAVGIAVSNGASLVVDGSRIADTQPLAYLPAGATVTVSAADGIGVYGQAHGKITGARISGNPRAAVLAKGCAAKADGSPDLDVTGCSISGSKWGVVVNGQYSQMAAVGAAPGNSYDGVDAEKQSNTQDLPAPESVCADGQYTCGSGI